MWSAAIDTILGMKERDLSYELGRANWIDNIAGEAVLLGAELRRADIEIAGTELAKMVREIQYNDDRFAKVIAFARAVTRQVDTAIRERHETTYIDAIYKGENLAKRDRWSWEYNIIYAIGRYQIQMILPVYLGNDVLLQKKKLEAERIVCGSFADPSFTEYKKEVNELDYSSQMYKAVSYRDQDGELLRVTTDHDHEGQPYRGWCDVFYFRDFETAWNAWQEMKKVVSS